LLPPVPTIGYLTSNALGYFVEQGLSRSVNCTKATKTRDSQLVHFFKFLDIYNKKDVYLSNDAIVTDDVMSKDIAFLFQGHTLNSIEVAVGTIQRYMAVVNIHYRENDFHPHFDRKSSF